MERMRFEEFKKAVVEGIKEWLPETFKAANVNLHVVTKNNDVKLTGLTITSKESNIAPTIYLEGFYETYQNGADMSEVLRKIADLRMQHDVPNDFDASVITEFERCKDKILPRLVGSKWNSQVLEARPHIIIEDLATVFCIDLGANEDGTMSVPIHNDLARSWGVTAEELYELAITNLENLDNASFKSINQVMMEMMGGGLDMDEDMLSDMMPPEDMMYVLTTKDKVNGACMLLNKKVMEKVVEKVGSDFFILPSSVHECLVVPAQDNMDISYLENMVQEVNASEVSEQERLSDRVYRYSLENGIELA